MHRLICGEEHRLVPWARERIGVSGFDDDARTIGLERDGQLVAVVVYDSFHATDVQMHIASDGTKRWMTRELLASAFWYPFVQVGLLRVTGLVPAHNKEALAFDQHLGFVIEGYHPRAGEHGEDLVSLGMLRERCRWIPEKYRNPSTRGEPCSSISYSPAASRL